MDTFHAVFAELFVLSISIHTSKIAISIDGKSSVVVSTIKVALKFAP